MIEPGIVAIALLLIVPASQLLGAALAGPHFRELMRLSDEVLDSEDATDDDRFRVYELLRESANRWPIWLAVAAGPLVAIPAFVAALYDFFSHRGETEEQMLADARQEHDDLTKLLAAHYGRDSVHSQAFRTRYERLTDAAIYGALLASPLLTIWVLVWLLPALLVFVVGGAIEYGLARFRLTYEVAALAIARSALASR